MNIEELQQAISDLEDHLASLQQQEQAALRKLEEIQQDSKNVKSLAASTALAVDQGKMSNQERLVAEEEYARQEKNNIGAAQQQEQAIAAIQAQIGSGDNILKELRKAETYLQNYASHLQSWLKEAQKAIG